jgi:hypothetical protein
MSSGLLDDTATGFGAPVVHPLVRFTEALDGLLDDTIHAAAWTMSPAELQRVLPRLTRAAARLAEVELRVLHAADTASVGDDVGATNTAHWWAHVTGQRIPAARSATVLAEKLDGGHEAVRTALAAGRVQVAQARVIVAAVEELPTDLVGPELVSDAEADLVGLADLDGEFRLDPKALRVAGRRVLEVVAPEIAEAHEKDVLEREERDAETSAYLHLRHDGHGSVIGKFKIPALHGAILTRHLTALAAPRHQDAVNGHGSDRGDADVQPARSTWPVRLGEAFCEYLVTRPTTGAGMPKAGGMAATVVVTMTLEQLRGGLKGSDKAAVLDTGEPISASLARRLACEAGIIPAVLGSTSQPLDLGRKTRFHTEPQRIALMLRDGGCAVVGCDAPPGMTHAHHKDSWSSGGGTSIDRGVLLCGPHHRTAHDARYQLKTDSHGRVTFTRRT